MTNLQPLSPSEGVEQFLAYRQPSVRESTFNNTKTRLLHFVSWCIEKEVNNLNTLTGRSIHSFVRWRQEQMKPIALQKQLSTIRAFLRWAADIDTVEPGLAEKVHAPSLPDGAEARDVALRAERAEPIISHLDQFEHGSRLHATMVFIRRAGIRRGTLRSFDLEDLRPDEHAIAVRHRPETDTPLKNGKAVERWLYLGPIVYKVVEDYVSYNRLAVIDDFDREPLLTTKYGRPHGTTIQGWVYRATQPCHYGECPHDRDPRECEALGADGVPSKCPSSVGPHAVRRGAITHFLNEGIPPEVVSERTDVSLEVLYRHYNARSQMEQMSVRREYFGE